MTMTIMLALLFAVAGAAWRFVDGLPHDVSRVPTGVRNAVTACLATGAASAAGFGWWSPWAGGWIALALIVGQTKWENPTWQAIRFGGPVSVAVLPIGMAGLPAVALATIGGVSYWALHKVDGFMPRFWLFDGPEAYARLVLGACTIGGLALTGIFLQWP